RSRSCSSRSPRKARKAPRARKVRPKARHLRPRAERRPAKAKRAVDHSVARSLSADYLIVGLGNPGGEFERSRHNSGADTVALLARRFGARLKRDKARALTASANVDGSRVLLAFPQTYYNDSGWAVAALARREDVIEEPERIIVVHDELDLEPG